MQVSMHHCFQLLSGWLLSLVKRIWISQNSSYQGVKYLDHLKYGKQWGYFGVKRLCWTENWVCNFLRATHGNPTVTTDWTHWLGEVTRTSELSQVKLFLIVPFCNRFVYTFKIAVYGPTWVMMPTMQDFISLWISSCMKMHLQMSFIGNIETLRRNCVPHLNVVFVNQPLFCTIVKLHDTFMLSCVILL